MSGNVNASRQRLTLSNLTEPQQIRELNRQLEWIWAQLMGGLSKKSLSSGLQSAIDSKAEDETVDALTGRVTAAESEIRQTPDKITAAVNAMEIGGTNLLHGVSVWGMIDGAGFGYDSSGASATGGAWGQDDGSLLVNNSSANLRLKHSDIAVQPGEVYTVSAEYKDVSGACPHQFQMVFSDSSGQTGDAAAEGDKAVLGDGWTRSTFTFTIPEGAAWLTPCFRSGEDETLYTHQYYIRHPKLERGNKATDWSPNPAEVRDIRVGSSILMDIDHTEINTPYFDVNVSGTDGDLHIDENGMAAGTATFDTINCPEIVKRVTGRNITITTPSGLQAEFDRINGGMLDGSETITLACDQYGDVTLRGMYGNYTNLTINGGGYAINGSILVIDSHARLINFDNVTINSTVKHAMEVYNSSYVRFGDCTINTAASYDGVRLFGGTLAVMYNVGIYNARIALNLDWGSRLDFLNLKGTASVYLAANGCVVTGNGSRPSGTWTGQNVISNYADMTTIAIDTGSGVTPPAAVTTGSYTANVTGTYYPSGHWIGDNTIRQGYEGTGSSARKDYGCMWFGASALSGKTIRSATLTIKRIAGKGRSGSVTMKLWTTTVTGKSGVMAASTLTSLGEICTIANGETATVSIPTSAISTIAAGGGLVLYTEETSNKTGKTYSENYAHFEGTDGSAPVLTVTYQ